jgi:hypothetical protein
MNMQQFREKHPKNEISDYIYSLYLGADHADTSEEEGFLRDLYQLFLELFPDCDPYKQD